jgi:hypothetical protein
MNIGIIVFAYNRSYHLSRVLEGLKKNEGVSKLYIFQDGLKCKQHQAEWKKTQQVIKNIDWCEVTYTLSSYNKGLAKSIVDGVNAVFAENDAVIVMEDDCVPAADFIRYMFQCFDKYAEQEQVYSVSGYSWPIALPENEYDIYGCGRISSWGWGTWKDRWEQYRSDNDILKRLKQDRNKSRLLAIWGNDCEVTVLNNIKGLNDSWAVYWALHVIENSGICINPYKSLIDNIGMDGSGVHCGVTERFQVEIADGFHKEFLLPEKPEILETTEKAFVELYGGYTALYEENQQKENVLIYGLGNFFMTNEEEINDMYNIKAFIDINKTGWFAGKKVISIDEIVLYEYDKIIIMLQKFQECKKVAQVLVNKGIHIKKIVMGHGCIKLDDVLRGGEIGICI